MAETAEKSNFNKILITCAVVSIALVLILKGRETEHLTNPGAGTTLEGNAAALSDAKRFSNVME